MPPWAAIECALRGESWYVMHFTLYPSSPSVAAAAAPARPEPTTMRSKRRRLCGATSFIENLWLSHFSSMAPSGMCASRFMPLSLALAFVLLADGMGHDQDRERQVADDDHGGEAPREPRAPLV